MDNNFDLERSRLMDEAEALRAQLDATRSDAATARQAARMQADGSRHVA